MNPERVQPLGDTQLVGHREVDPFTLTSVAQGGVIYLYSRIHNQNRTATLPMGPQNAKGERPRRDFRLFRCARANSTKLRGCSFSVLMTSSYDFHSDHDR